MQDVLIEELSDCSEELQEVQDLNTIHGQWRKKEDILPLLIEEGNNEPQK